MATTDNNNCNRIEITHNEAFLRRFRHKELVVRTSKEDVEVLSKAAAQGDAYAQYAYGRWLYYNNANDDEIGKAEQLFLATKDLLPDALAAYAIMLRYGDTKENVMDIEQSNNLLQQAANRGSEMAAQKQARFRIFGVFCDAEPESVAKEIEDRLESSINPDPYWHALLAFAYEELNRTDDAIAQYVQATQYLSETDCWFYLASIYEQNGNQAKYKETIEEGIAKGSGLCCTYHATMDEEEYQKLPKEEQKRLHQEIEDQLHKGLGVGDGFCAFYLWLNYYYGGLGYTIDKTKAFKYLQCGVRLGNVSCIEYMAELAEYNELPEPMSATDIAELWLKAARNSPSDDDALRGLSRVNDAEFLLRHKDEIEKYWQPKFPVYNIPPKKEKTPIPSSVIIIWPTGHLDVVEADIYSMKSYKEMAQELINAEGLDAIHYSPLLYTIGEAAGLDMSLTMYCDRDGYAKNLPDNAIGTILYGQGQEIRGPIIIAQEDARHDCHSFNTLEDLVNTYREINSHCDGLLIIKDEEDGKFDAYV